MIGYNKPMAKDGAIVGVADHSGWAVLVTVADDGTFLDRRRIELVDAGLPMLPHHHECQGLPIEQALELVERVRTSAERHAKSSLDALAAAVPRKIRGVAVRECPPLPETVAERIRNYRAQCVADGVMSPDGTRARRRVARLVCSLVRREEGAHFGAPDASGRKACRPAMA